MYLNDDRDDVAFLTGSGSSKSLNHRSLTVSCIHQMLYNFVKYLIRRLAVSHIHQMLFFLAITIDKNFVNYLIGCLSSLQVSLGERTASGTSMKEAMWLFVVTSRSVFHIVQAICILQNSGNLYSILFRPSVSPFLCSPPSFSPPLPLPLPGPGTVRRYLHQK